MVVPIIGVLDIDPVLGGASVTGMNVSAPTAPTDPYSGQQTITTQSLAIEYYRQPIFGWQEFTASSVDLSSAVVPEQQFGTIVRMKITAHSEQKILSGIFGGSSMFIPQTFDVHVESKDSHGNSYDLSSLSGIAGPKGRILTRNMGVYRRPTQTNDTTWNESVVGVLNYSDISGYSSNQRYWGNWDLDNRLTVQVSSVSPDYWMGGTYDPANEDPKHVAQLINDLAHQLRNHGYYDNQIPAVLQKVPHYNPQFHSYT